MPHKIYHDIKQEILRIYAPKAKDSYCKALTRTLVGLPSQLGSQIVDDICKKPNKLKDCCCAGAAQALWSLQLPVNVREHISTMEFDHKTYKKVFESADSVYLSSKSVQVAALSAMNETLPAFTPQNQPAAEVAAVAKQQKPKKNKNNKNRNRGKKHSSVPENKADQMCDRHYRHGENAWYCLAPSSCPWKDRCKPQD